MGSGPTFDLEIRGLTADSRRIEPGYLFAALPGSRHDGRAFIDDAVTRGAVAVLAEPGTRLTPSEPPVALLADPNPRRALARMAATFYDRQPATIAAVTGTNGKTSVADFVRQIWQQQGFAAASLGTLGANPAHRSAPDGLTTPDPVALHGYLAALANDGTDHLVLEASSHGLVQYRLDGLKLTAAAFTNLTRDHLDYHGSMKAYLAAKSRLFLELLPTGGTAVLNADLALSEALAEDCRKRGIAVLSYGTGPSDIRLQAQAAVPEGQALRISALGRDHELVLPLAGSFQALNVLAALGLVIATGGDSERALAAVPTLHGVPGRIERIGRSAGGGSVYVDYAHTPGALETVLKALRPHTTGRLVAVFGCGGDRDAGKRPEMGAAVKRQADLAIVTDDNPRGEDPAAIRRAVLAAIPDAEEIGDRGEAIARAVAALGPGDTLVIAGKGHERGQIVGETILPFDDREVARALVVEGGGTPA